MNNHWLSVLESSKIIHCGIILNVPSCYNCYQASYLYNNRSLEKYLSREVEQHDIDQEITSRYNQLRVWRYQRPEIFGKTLIVTTHSVKKHKVQWHMRMTQIEHKANRAHIHKTAGKWKIKLFYFSMLHTTTCRVMRYSKECKNVMFITQTCSYLIKRQGKTTFVDK